MLLNLNQINIASDTLPCAFCTDHYIQHYFGGATARGAHSGYFAWLIQTLDNSGAGVTNNTAGTFVSQANTGDGGTGVTTATSKGAVIATNPVARNAGTNLQIVNAAEDDLQTTAGSTAQYTFGHSIANFEAAQGAFDSALVIYSGGSIAAAGGSGPWGPGIGFHNGISFAELSGNGLSPVDSGATLFSGHVETLGTINAANGIDLSNFTFSGSAFKSLNFNVSQTGTVFATNYYLNGALFLNGATGAAMLTKKTFATLPTCNAALEGALFSVSDSNSVVFNAAVAGGGAGHVMAFCDGTSWKVH